MVGGLNQLGLRTDGFTWRTISKWYLRDGKSMQKCPSISGQPEKLLEDSEDAKRSPQQ